METDENIPPERPVFLKVLCILTFFCSGWLMVTSTVTYFTANDISYVIDSAKDVINRDIEKNKNVKENEDNAFEKKIMESVSSMYTVENIRKNALGTMAGALFCLVGAILMWRLNRIGYVLYVTGTVIGVTTPFYLFGNNFIAVVASGFTAFFGLLFVIFYAMNLKSMR